jgi:hypothetical protein
MSGLTTKQKAQAYEKMQQEILPAFNDFKSLIDSLHEGDFDLRASHFEAAQTLFWRLRDHLNYKPPVIDGEINHWVGLVLPDDPKAFNPSHK